ncbi:MAG TPA: BrnT family toxin [Spirochaetota bacterium]|nr:BrnT family toxin [Spirochaetota bacterium]
MKFEWNEQKKQKNILMKISFEEAAYVFSDLDAISLFDEEHSDNEERWITIGEIRTHGIIVVVHTERIKGEHEYIRIISARKSEKNEEIEYINRKGGK